MIMMTPEAVERRIASARLLLDVPDDVMKDAMQSPILEATIVVLAEFAQRFIGAAEAWKKDQGSVVLRFRMLALSDALTGMVDSTTRGIGEGLQKMRALETKVH